MDTGLFQEPEGYFKPDKQPTMHKYMRVKSTSVPSELEIRLVGDHPLYGHMLWNASKALSDYFDEHPDYVSGKSVLELGAGSGLPSLVAALNNAKRVVITDYPDQPLLDNIQFNVTKNIPPHQISNVEVRGHLWGKDPELLLGQNGEKFDVIILSDLLFNHTFQPHMLASCAACLKPVTGLVIVTFSHHVPNRSEGDMAFFTKAKTAPFTFVSQHLWDRYMGPMFPDDSGSLEMRATVHCYQLYLPQ